MNTLRRRALLLGLSTGLPIRALGRSPRGLAQISGGFFAPPPAHPNAPPRVVEIRIPTFPDINAIWGASGRDDSGAIWFGVSAVHDQHSAHLLRYDPVTGEMTSHGDVLQALQSIRPLRPGEGQIKIHSKLIQADDGYLYFTSTDEEGEAENGSAPPRWGSHLWRLRPDENSPWEHLMAVPEGLTCAGGAGRWIYTLGYWNHVLYRHDTQTGAILRREIGSVGGHMCRNLVVDANGHVYVPRVIQTASGLNAQLVELDPDLNEIASTPLDHYADGQTPSDAHGIIGFTFLANGSIVIATGVGYLYRIDPKSNGKSAIEPLGWFHPKGIAYTPSLFVWDGVSSVVGIGLPPGGNWDWVVFDLKTRLSTTSPLPHGQGDPVLLYGTNTRDNQGRFYLVGRRHEGQGRAPVILQLDTT